MTATFARVRTPLAISTPRHPDQAHPRDDDGVADHVWTLRARSPRCSIHTDPLAAGRGRSHPFVHAADDQLTLSIRDADPSSMHSYVQILRQRVRASRYAVDERSVAEAMLARARPRLAAKRADAHLAGLEKQIKQFRFDNRGSAATAAAPARSVRRATARRASGRRATARSRQGDTTARIIGFLTRHPESTAGDLGRSLNLEPGSVSTRLSELADAGEIKKLARGYITQQTTPRRRHRR